MKLLWTRNSQSRHNKSFQNKKKKQACKELDERVPFLLALFRPSVLAYVTSTTALLAAVQLARSLSMRRLESAHARTRTHTPCSYKKLHVSILKYLSVSRRLRAEVGCQRSAPSGCVDKSKRGKSLCNSHFSPPI